MNKHNRMLKLIVIVLSLLGFTLPSVSLAAEKQDDIDQKLQAIETQTTNLQNEVTSLKDEVKRLKTKKQKHTHKHKNHEAIDPEHLILKPASERATVAQFLQGFPVTTSPYLGVRSDFEGTHLISNLPSVNEDLRILRQRQKLIQALEQRGQEFPRHPMVELSGAINAQAFYGRPFSGAKTGDIDLTSVELDTNITLTSWVSGFLAFVYDNAPPTPPRVTRTTNSRIFLDKGFVTVGNLDKTPFYVTIGQLFVPFGQFATNMVSNPLPKLFGRTKARPIIFGYQDREGEGFYAQTYIAKGDARNGGGRNNEFGGNIGYDLNRGDYSATFDVGMINNIANADGMQSSGAGGFTGFGASSAAERLNKTVPGFDAFVNLAYHKWSMLAEYVGATTEFSRRDLTYNGSGARPQGVNVEAAYKFPLFKAPSSFALGYGHTWEALAFNLPRNRFAATLNSTIWRDTLTSLEYRHDTTYNKGDTAMGRGTTGALVAATGSPLGRSSDTVTLQMAVFF